MGIRGGKTIPPCELAGSDLSVTRGDADSGSGAKTSGSGSSDLGPAAVAGVGVVAGRSVGVSIGVFKGAGVSAALSDSMCCRLTDWSWRISASSSGVGMVVGRR